MFYSLFQQYREPHLRHSYANPLNANEAFFTEELVIICRLSAPSASSSRVFITQGPPILAIHEAAAGQQRGHLIAQTLTPTQEERSKSVSKWFNNSTAQTTDIRRAVVIAFSRVHVSLSLVEHKTRIIENSAAPTSSLVPTLPARL